MPRVSPNSTALPRDFVVLTARLAQFYAAHGRLPRMTDGETKEERLCGEHLRHHRRRLHRTSSLTMQSMARLAYLDEHVPGWRTMNTRTRARAVRQEPFEGRVRAVERFTRKHDRFPRSGRPGSAEARLAGFLVNQRQASKGRGTTAWSTSRQQILDTRVPGWNDDTLPRTSTA